MRLVSSKAEQTDNANVVRVGLAVDETTYYAALVDTQTNKCYVEELGLASKNMGYQGVYRQIKNEREWQVVYRFFRLCGVFDKFLHGKEWYWSGMNEVDSVPVWFKDQFQGDK